MNWMLLLALMPMIFIARVPAGTPLVDRIALSRDELFPANFFLVGARAEVAKSWEIDHVYVGPAELKGKIISDAFKRQLIPYITQQLPPPPVLTGAGIFWITGGLLPAKDTGWRTLEFTTGSYTEVKSRICFLHSRLKEDSLYPAVRSVAEALEKIYLSSDERRLRTIDTVVKNGDREAGVAALWLVAWNCKSRPMTQYLRNLADDRSLPIAVQIHLYLALADRVDDWINSEAAMRMANRWLSEPWKESLPESDKSNNSNLLPWDQSTTLLSSDENLIIACLRSTVRTRREFSPLHVCDLTLKATSNREHFAKLIPSLLHEVKCAQRLDWEAKQRAECFTHITQTIKGGSSRPERIAAAKLLAVFAPFEAGQAKQIGDLLAGTTDDAVRRELRAVLGE
jgi:hypothetical protein